MMKKRKGGTYSEIFSHPDIDSKYEVTVLFERGFRETQYSPAEPPSLELVDLKLWLEYSKEWAKIHDDYFDEIIKKLGGEEYIKETIAEKYNL